MAQGGPQRIVNDSQFGTKHPVNRLLNHVVLTY